MEPSFIRAVEKKVGSSDTTTLLPMVTLYVILVEPNAVPSDYVNFSKMKIRLAFVGTSQCGDDN